MPELEWPKGSGRTAYYSDEERAAAAAMLAAAGEQSVRPRDILREFGVLHDLKVELDARLLPDSYRPPLLEPTSFYRPPADSPFQIPEGVLRDLAYDGPQRDPDE